MTITPQTIYDHLPYLESYIVETLEFAELTEQERKALEQHKESALIDFFDFAENMPEMSLKALDRYTKIVCRNFSKGWTTKFNPNIID